MAVKTGKELLKAFHLFKSLSNPEKHRMTAIKQTSSPPDFVSDLEIRITFGKSKNKVLKTFIESLGKVPACPRTVLHL
jgi:hypothetical protein